MHNRSAAPAGHSAGVAAGTPGEIRARGSAIALQQEEPAGRRLRKGEGLRRSDTPALPAGDDALPKQHSGAARCARRLQHKQHL